MRTAYLLTGGNLGDRQHNLQHAMELIVGQCGDILLASAVYETAAWGLTDQPAFYNQALSLATTLEPEQLMRTLLDIEETMGRKRVVKLGPRIIDLDILLIDGLVIESDLLTLPHPALPFRRFALLPLAEIAPALVHPVSHKTIRQMLLECSDPLDVQKKTAVPD